MRGYGAPRTTTMTITSDLPPNQSMGGSKIAKGNTWGRGLSLSGSNKQGTKPLRPFHTLVDQLEELPPVANRTSTVVQTTPYLEEIPPMFCDTDECLQTDPFEERPPTPEYMPQPQGIDVATEIGENDLFCFDREVEPLLRMLVGSALQQSLSELAAERETRRLRAARAKAEQTRREQLQKVQQLEEKEKRLYEEKERRRAQELRRLALLRSVEKKMTAAGLASSVASGLLDSVIGTLDAEGYFYDDTEVGVGSEFVPYLIEKARGRFDRRDASQKAAEELIRAAFPIPREADKEEMRRQVRERMKKIDDEIRRNLELKRLRKLKRLQEEEEEEESDTRAY